MQNTYNFIYSIGFRCSHESKSRIQVLQTPKPPVTSKSLLEMSYLIKGSFPSQVVPLCHDPIVKAGDVLVTYVSRSQFYELGKCVSYSSSFKHPSR